MLDWTHIFVYYTSSLHKSPQSWGYVYAKDGSHCIPTKWWFPHGPVSVITCCTQRNQALLWTSLPQTHRWCCYYSSLVDFSGKEGTLTHFLSFEEANREMTFQAFFPNSSFDGWVKGNFLSSVSWTCTSMTAIKYENECTNKKNIYILLLTTSAGTGIWSLLCISNCGEILKHKLKFCWHLT